MQMIRIESLEEKHRMAVIDIFNYYVEHKNSAYPQTKVGYEAFDMFLENAKHLCGYAITSENGEILGFCQLKPYRPQSTFERTVEVTYFLKESATGKGIGKEILEYLIQDAKRLGKKHILASISGDNAVSLKFHKNNGFTECGRFKNIGNKFGKEFDIVYMQKEI